MYIAPLDSDYYIGQHRTRIASFTKLLAFGLRQAFNICGIFKYPYFTGFLKIKK